MAFKFEGKASFPLIGVNKLPGTIFTVRISKTLSLKFSIYIQNKTVMIHKFRGSLRVTGDLS